MMFRQKPVVVYAQQFTHKHVLGESPLPAGVEMSSRHIHPGRREIYSHHHYIQTPSGKMPVEIGDWVVTNLAGERHSYNTEAFDKMFEAEK